MIWKKDGSDITDKNREKPDTGTCRNKGMGKGGVRCGCLAGMKEVHR